ncbi:MAG: hypothetical protein RJQ09_11155 [Cyclobacteriaceae bacterium]
MLERLQSLAGVFAFYWVLLVYIVYSWDKPEYSHMADKFSVLLRDNPWFGLFGYVIPGCLVAYQGYVLKQKILGGLVSWLPMIAFISFGIFLAIGGIMPVSSSGEAHILQTFSELGSFFFFLIAALTINAQLKLDLEWKSLHVPNTLLLWLVAIVTFFQEVEGIGGLMNKVAIFGGYFWVAIFSYRSFKLTS